MKRKKTKKRGKLCKNIPKGCYRTFETSGQTIIIDDFIYRRLFKDPDIPPRRKYTFIQGFRFFNNYPYLLLKSPANKSIPLSRYIMHSDKCETVDHRNRNRLDNRRCNLRIVNARQNMLNRKLKNNTGFIGVCAYSRKDNFYVKSGFKTKEGKRLIFHCPDTPFNRILAALARDKLVLQAGEEEYAPLNFPQWQYKPLRGILMKEDLNCFKESISHKGTSAKGRNPKLNKIILRFCRARAKRSPRRHEEKKCN